VTITEIAVLDGLREIEWRPAVVRRLLAVLRGHGTPNCDWWLPQPGAITASHAPLRGQWEEEPMPKPALRPSPRSYPELAEIVAENERLKRQNVELKAQIAAIQVGVKAVLDSIALPESDRPH
jgi:hypothetical protein